MTPNVVGEDPSLDGTISFQPNIIPELQIHFVEEFFRFQWLENRFDLKLLIHCEGKNLSLRDFWEKTDRLVKWKQLKNKATESMYEFGYMIEDIPQEIADNVEFLVWKIEGASFDVDEIELREIELIDEGYNITRFHLPDNLVLSYEDLWLYNYTVFHPQWNETIVKGVKGKSSWNLDPITFSSGKILITQFTEGAQCAFSDLYDADQGGTLTLRSGSYGISGNTLTTQIQPADDLVLKIDFILDGTTAGRNDELIINGTDKDDEIQLETILTESDGTYTTTKWFKTIVDFDCDNFGDGTITVRQNRWGIIWKEDDSFVFDVKIEIGDATWETWFSDSKVNVLFKAGILSANAQHLILVRSNAHLTLGVLLNTTTKATSEGIHLIDLETAYYHHVIYAFGTAETNIYSSIFTASRDTSRYVFRNGKLYNSQFNSDVVNGSTVAPKSMDVFNCQIFNGFEGWASPSGSSIEKLYVFNSYYGFWLATTNVVLENAYGRNNTYTFRLDSNKHSYIVNADVDTWSISWIGEWLGITPRFNYRQYTFDLTVTYPNGTAIQNANVTITHYGQGETQDFTELTDASGQIAQKTLTMGFYNQTGGDTIYSYNPHNITITYSGMQSYSKNFTLAEQTEWIIALQTEPEADYNWFAATIIMGLFACFMVIYALTTKT